MKTRLVLKLALLVAALELLFLGFMVYQREEILLNGTAVWLQTGPVDPRDPFRGDYVRLRYPELIPDNARASKALLKLAAEHGTPLHSSFTTALRNQSFYAVLTPRPNSKGYYTPTLFDVAKPDSGVFIKGRYEASSGPLYGIEALFTEQGKAIQIERAEDLPPRAGAKLEVEARIGSNGTAVLTGKYRYPSAILGAAMQTRYDFKQDTSIPIGTVTLYFANLSADTAMLLLPPNLWTVECLTERGEHNAKLIRPEETPFSDSDWVMIPPKKTITRVYPLGYKELLERGTVNGCTPNFFRFRYRKPSAVTLPNPLLETSPLTLETVDTYSYPSEFGVEK